MLQRRLLTASQAARVQAVLDKPLPTIKPFDRVRGYVQVSEHDSQGVLAPWSEPDAVDEKPRRK